MIEKRKVFVTAAVFCAAFGRAWAQAPQFATLDIEWENAVGYVDVVSPNPRTFMPFYGIADIVSVNGKPARGSWVLGGRLIARFPTPMPGRQSETLVGQRWSICTWRSSRPMAHASARS